MFPPLNLPAAALKRKGDQVWDPIRRKYIRLTPEEWVRQHFIAYLIHSKGYAAGRMVSEYKVIYNGMNKRCDIAVFNTDNSPLLIVECKAPHISITEDTFYQAAKYAHVLKAPLLLLTNGLDHYAALVNQATGDVQYLENIPTQEELFQFIG